MKLQRYQASQPPHRFLTYAVAVLTMSGSYSLATPSVARQWNEALLNAIRKNSPNPLGHARNLFHTAVAMYDAWSAYNPTSVGYVTNEKITPLPGDVEAARAEAISYASYRVIRARFLTTDTTSPNYPGWINFTNGAINNLLTTQYGAGAVSTAQAAVNPTSTAPAEVGKRIGQAILNWGASDGFSLTAYPQAYNAAVNSNMNVVMSVQGSNLYVSNAPLGEGIPALTNPNKWQPLDLATSVDQGGNVLQSGKQSFVGVQSLATTPFSLTRTDPLKPWYDPHGGPSQLSAPAIGATPAVVSPSDASFKAQIVGVIRDGSVLNSTANIDISPGAIGNNALGQDNGTGNPVNPVTGLPYAPNVVKLGDYTRVLAEFWADGPSSETPPGHWHVLANEVTDLLSPSQKRIKGVGSPVNDLEWDVKMYFSLAGGVHDAACAAWSLKRYYSGPRPISLIRWLCNNGPQDEFNPYGIPLETDVVEVVTEATSAVGGKHEQIWDVGYGGYYPGSSYLGVVVVRCWPGENPNNPGATSGLPATNPSPVRWVVGRDWLPFQRKTFNTPAFPGYISGHSTFSRSAAEVLAKFTGSPDFPGSFHHHTVAANSMLIDKGPSVDIDLQWRSYYDAADQAGQSRRYGGIHVSEDDYHGREIGAKAGVQAFTLAEKYWTGAILSENMRPNVTVTGPTTATLTWTNTRGMSHKVQTSPDLITWTDATTATVAYDTNGTYTDNNADVTKKFYRVVRSAQ